MKSKINLGLYMRSVRRFIFGAFLVSTFIAAASARPVPQNLGNGLDKIVENSLLQQGLISPPSQTQSVSNPKGSTAKKTAARDAADYTANYKATIAKEARRFKNSPSLMRPPGSIWSRSCRTGACR